MKKRFLGMMLSLCLGMMAVVPAGASVVDEESELHQGNTRVMTSVLNNAEFMTELKKEAPSADLINANNVASFGENFVTFERNVLLDTTLEGDVEIEIYKKEIAGVYYTGDSVELPIDPVVASPAATGTQSDDTIDSTSSVRIYSTIYFNRYLESGVEMIKLTAVSGSYTRTASGVSVSNQALRIGQTGFTMNDGYLTQYRDYIPTASTWSYTPPSTWKALVAADYRIMGADYTVTLKRGTSTWTVYLTNNY